MELKDFARKMWHLYGVDGNVFVVRQKSHQTLRAFEAVEDETDDYRSCLKEVRELSDEEMEKVVHSKTPVVEALGEYDSEDVKGDTDFLTFTDKGGHVWLTVGTDYTAEDYPLFTFTWTPKASE